MRRDDDDDDVEYEGCSVNFGAPRRFTTVFNSKVKEALFPDDPFRQLKSERRCGRGAVRYFVPILEWLPNYSLSLLKYDVLAGITIASVAIPQGISYANLAQIPPIIGLYSSFVPPLVYAVLGSSKHVAVGTVAASSLMIAEAIQQKVGPDNTEVYVSLVFTATFFAGLFQAALGVFR